MKPVIRAPRNHGELACDPPLADLPFLLANHGKVSNSAAYSGFQEQLRLQARGEFCQFLSGSYPHLDPTRIWVGTGHQPEVFHPGVWAKNFIAGGMGESLRSASFNVVIDTDCPKEMGIRLPDLSITANARRSRLCHFSTLNPGIPWAQIPREMDHFDSFIQTLEAWARQADFSPLANSWVVSLRTRPFTFQNGPAWVLFHQARIETESGWGLRQFSLPMSRISGFPSFLRLVRLFLTDSQRAREAYNGALEKFRAFHQVATPGRPVPRLEERDGWAEAPLWIYEDGSNHRERLWIKEEPGGILLAQNPNHPAPHALRSGDIEAGLGRLADSGVRLWPRALFTTLYLRSFVFDWFVHGIGGALYDQITEDWAAHWLGIHPGPMVAASLTMRLPLAPPRSGPQELRKAQHLQHHLVWNPDLLLNPFEKGKNSARLEELERLRAESPDPGLPSKNRFHRIRELVESLRECAKGSLEAGWTRLTQLQQFAPEAHLVANREYAYPLHPAVALQKHLQPLLHLREAAATVSD